MLSTDYRKFLRSGFSLGKGGKLFQTNERLILNQIFWGTEITQRQIIDITKIPQQTASRLIKSLLNKKAVVQSTRRSDGSRGQPGYCLEPNPDYAYCLGVSLYVDSIAIAIVNFRGELVLSRSYSLDSVSVENVIQLLQYRINEILADTGIGQDYILGLGFGIAGYFQALDGKINTTIDEWATVDIEKVLAKELSIPVWVENDAKAAAAGESIAGVGRKYSDFVYLYIATGFGGGVIMNGEILRGAHGNAGEVAEMLPPKIYLHPNLELLRQILIRNGNEINTVADLTNNFDIEWPGVDEWIAKVKDSLSLVASSSAALLDIKAVVLGGHIPQQLSLKLLEHIEIYAQNRRSLPRSIPDLVVAQAEGDPVAIGAATLPLRACCL